MRAGERSPALMVYDRSVTGFPDLLGLALGLFTRGLGGAGRPALDLVRGFAERGLAVLEHVLRDFLDRLGELACLLTDLLPRLPFGGGRRQQRGGEQPAAESDQP